MAEGLSGLEGLPRVGSEEGEETAPKPTRQKLALSLVPLPSPASQTLLKIHQCQSYWSSWR